jgi:hypothetical protein
MRIADEGLEEILELAGECADIRMLIQAVDDEHEGLLSLSAGGS